MRSYGTDRLEQPGSATRVIIEFCNAHGLGAAVVHKEQVLEMLPERPVLAWTIQQTLLHLQLLTGPPIPALAKRWCGEAASRRRVAGMARGDRERTFIRTERRVANYPRLVPVLGPSG
jgi:hypothetical protein